MIPESEWIWHGHALHLCVRERCQFRMGTEVGKVVVSTIGEYKDPFEENGHQNIGAGRDEFYETMVFTVSGHNLSLVPRKYEAPDVGNESCCPRIGDELLCVRYADSVSARRGHMEICYRAAKGEWQ